MEATHRRMRLMMIERLMMVERLAVHCARTNQMLLARYCVSLILRMSMLLAVGWVAARGCMNGIVMVMMMMMVMRYWIVSN